MRSAPFRHALPVLLAIASTASASAPDAREPGFPPMSGEFFGTLPLGGCALADALLRLDPGQRYSLQAHCRATLEDLPQEQGDWSVEWNGTCMRLVPEGLTDAREFAIAQEDLLVLAEGSCIEPIADPRDRSLHRARPRPEGH